MVNMVGMEEDVEGEEEGQNRGSAVAQWLESQPSAQPSQADDPYEQEQASLRAKSGMGGSSQCGRQHGLFTLVSDTAAVETLRLPELRPIRVMQAGAGDDKPDDDAVCDVCGDGDAGADNLILLCEGKGCRWALQTWACCMHGRAGQPSSFGCHIHHT
jgi:hypothetical protein